MTDSLSITDEAAAAVAKEPRITKAQIEDNIRDVIFVNGEKTLSICKFDKVDRPAINPKDYGHLTICMIKVMNGFIVVGKSAPMDPRNYNEELGQRLAYEDAFRQLWPLYAFASLEDKLLYEDA